MIEVITHLAFYAVWPNAMNAVQLTQELLTKKDAARWPNQIVMLDNAIAACYNISWLGRAGRTA